MTPIQICKNFYKSVSIYVIVRVNLGVRIDSRVRAIPSFGSEKPDPKNLGIAEPGILTSFLSFTIILLSSEVISLSYTIA